MKKYLIDFENLKLGDSVWSIQAGDTKVIKIDNKANYPISTGVYSYNVKGFNYNEHKSPSLFKSNPFEYPKMMLVSDDNKNWLERKVYCEDEGFYISLSMAYNYAKELPAVNKLTMQQIADKFGYDVETIKIEG